MKKILFATHNKNKIREAKEILNVYIQQTDITVDEVQTLDPIYCVERKAEAAYTKLKKPLLVEDSSLFINAWKGLPGVFIDYFMKSMEIKGLLKNLKNEKKRSAVAQTSVCYFDGKNKITAKGIVKGSISKKELGTNGFGWDSIFIPKGYKKTFSQMDNKSKNSISMRKLAFEELKRKLHL